MFSLVSSSFVYFSCAAFSFILLLFSTVKCNCAVFCLFVLVLFIFIVMLFSLV